jgi:hypothetical protein
MIITFLASCFRLSFFSIVPNYRLRSPASSIFRAPFYIESDYIFAKAQLLEFQHSSEESEVYLGFLSFYSYQMIYLMLEFDYSL